ncbi:MAG: SMC family ATPase [Candidatus Caldarchaeum sp.]
MITSIAIKNFMSHSNTTIQLRNGLNIFVGKNGAGKSSVIDAFLYCIYGKHGRGDARNTVNNLTHLGGEVAVELSYGGSVYRVVRRFKANGGLDHTEVRKDGRLTAVGERKKEAVSQYITNLFGMDYDRLKSCVVIQQGELDQILSMRPKELKNLFDDLIGIGSEQAFNNMKKVMDAFAERVRKEYGRPITDAETLPEEIKTLQSETEKLEKEITSIANQLEEVEKTRQSLEAELHTQNILLQTYRETLLKYQNLLTAAEKWCTETSRELAEAERHVELLEKQKQIQEQASEYEAAKQRQQRLEDEIRSLEKEQEEWRKRLETLSGSFPTGAPETLSFEQAKQLAERLIHEVAELLRKALEAAYSHDLANVQKWLNMVEAESRKTIELVELAYSSGLSQALQKTLKEFEEMIADLGREIQRRKNMAEEAGEKVRRLEQFDGMTIKEAVERLGKAILWTQQKNITSKTTLQTMRQKINAVKTAIEKLKTKNLEKTTAEELEPLSSLDGQPLEWLADIKQALPKISCLDPHRLEEIEQGLAEINEQKGRLSGIKDEKEKKLKEKQEEIRRLQNVWEKLAKANEFYNLLELVRNEVYNRDGYVPRSLRSWAVKKVSAAVSRYVDTLNIMVDDMTVTEENGEVILKCFSRGREVALESLSGGEKVGVALAFRLALGDVLGAEKLGFFILDEPTIHLDYDNRSRLSNLFTSLTKTVNQVIVITHDEDVFEGVDAVVYHFSRNAGEPTKVTMLS